MQGVSDVGSAQFGLEVQPRECIPSQMVRSDAVENYGYQLNMKTEPHMFHAGTADELHFLRSRVQVLEREKAEMAAENRRLKDLLVKEIPHLLSTMWQTLTSNTGQASHRHSAPAMTEPSAGVVNGYSAMQYKDQSCGLPPSAPAATKGLQHDMIMETGSFGHKMAACHNGADAALFEVAEVSGDMCPPAIAEDEQNLYLSSPCSTSDSASSCNEHRPLALGGTPMPRWRFPLARKGQIGTGINSKLSEMRFRSRRVKRDRHER